MISSSIQSQLQKYLRLFSMNVDEFKKSYSELNPRANVLTLDGDAERMISQIVVSFSFLFNLFCLGAFMLFDTDRNGKKIGEKIVNRR